VPGLRSGREEWLRREAIPALQPLADVIFEKAVYRRKDIDAAVAACEAAGADALLVMLLTYSPSLLALPALKRTHLPIVVWNTQELRAVGEGFDSAAMLDNHGVHGTQDLASVLGRSGVKFEYVTSHLGDAGGIEKLGDFFAAAAAVRKLRASRIGLMGYPFPGMGDFAVETDKITAALGCRCVKLSVEDYIDRAAAAGQKETAELVATYRESYDVADDLTDEDLQATARVELALRGMVGDNKLDAITYQFLSFGENDRTPTVPFVAASRLMAEGIGFGGEGDLIGAAGTSLLNWLKPPASFAEMFTIDFEGNAVFMSHMGEANVAMARTDRKVRLVARQVPITPTRHRQLALVTSFQPGAATLCALTLGPAERWRLVAAQMAIDDFAPLA
ncbi:MAG: hypothetical protein KAU28_01075, partial [Phycisphaerae bacterium]|nr:hypothetical protein [Phycisphaerae bacterium]